MDVSGGNLSPCDHAFIVELGVFINSLQAHAHGMPLNTGSVDASSGQLFATLTIFRDRRLTAYLSIY